MLLTCSHYRHQLSATPVSNMAPLIHWIGTNLNFTEPKDQQTAQSLHNCFSLFFLFQSSFFSGCTYACTDTQDDMKHYLEVLFKFTLHNSIDVQLKNYLMGFVTFHALTLYG